MCKSILFTVCALLWASASLALGEVNDGVFEAEAVVKTAPVQLEEGGVNTCQLVDLPDYFQQFYVHLPSSLFDESVCGQCIRVKGIATGASDASFTVMVVDRCTTCSDTELDFSVEAMAAITGYMWESKAVAWEWAECDRGADAAATLGVEAVAAAPEKRKRRKEQPEVTAVAPDAEGAAAATTVVQPASRKLLRLRR
ncbi:hypothetical protein D9Q98_010185 [Chlorella vulgaris]|uniref:Barwin domain-containing protein n=1 Tax=Chlorella vulgaris TaxID=3077 RepID=A0A9D4TMV0_CHLVU|nr:hypothetical protein D9Q98_010185 [Chlorella vulgaris]